MIKTSEGKFSNTSTVQFNKFQYALKAKSPKGFLDWSYKPFFNMRINEGPDRGNLTELDTDKLNFSLTAPVDMIPQQSYDGSINLIINDKRNPPRLINSRFTVREKNTYERVDRLGENDTNIYDVNKFQLQTSLLKLYSLIPTVQFNGETTSGNLLVGNYVFYFTYCDADENETDIVAESGVVSIFKGLNKSPNSIDGGFRDENSYKSVSFTLKNIDSEYSYIKVYYVRYSADINEHRVLNAYKIYQKYQVKDNKCNILITGLEYAQEISENDINIQYSNISTAGALAVVQNRLFLGNIEQVDPLYRDLADVSLRILPTYLKVNRNLLIGDVDLRYCDYSVLEENYEYYNSNNIYNYVGYHPGEIYRIGIVYMMNDNSLSPVYNIRGKNGIPVYSETEGSEIGDNGYVNIPLYQENITDEKVRRYIDCIDETSYEFIDRPKNENSKGVIRIDDSKDDLEVYNLRFKMSLEVLDYLKSKVKGFFFVRQKRMPIKLGQALLLPIEKNSSLPMIPYSGKDIIEGLMDKDRLLTHEYKQRILEVAQGRNDNLGCLIFPEYELDLPYYNTLFTGGEFYIEETYSNNRGSDLNRDELNERHYYIKRTSQTSSGRLYNKVKLIQVADNLKLCGIDDYKFSARAGEAEEAFRYEKTNADTESKEAYNYIRGSFGPYVGITSTSKLTFGKVVDVYIPGYSKSAYNNYFKIRYLDVLPYLAISDRKNFTDMQSFSSPVYRGDSYICNFTHRLNRNFQDPTAPLNDKIVDKKTWKDNFDVSDGVVKKENFEKINLGDVNAIKLGSWITFKVRASKNISIRSNDSSLTDEMALFGHPRTFYPLSPMSAEGSFKIPESSVYNDAFASTLGTKQYILLPDVPYLKDKFQTRIFYSDIYVNDAYINGFRRFLGNAHRDYESQYGGIVKLLPYNRDLICVFEHGIVKLAINQLTPISLNPEEPVFVNSHNVLPENMIVISDTIGSQWKDSIIKTDTSIYGVDTHAKKIWRLGQNGLESLSDYKLQQFLNHNITLLENETTPYLGIRNIKTHYNRNKGDIMFTYYDDLNEFEERVWNLCYNEKILKWTTFYSWVPSFSVNLYNNYFTFDRNTLKYVARLGVSWNKANDSTGITVESDKNEAPLLDKGSYELNLKNVEYPDVKGVTPVMTYTAEKDIYGFYYKDGDSKNCYKITGNTLTITNPTKMMLIMEKYKMPVALLNISCEIKLQHDTSQSTLEDLVNSYYGYQEYNADLFKQVVALTTELIYNARSQEELQGLNLSSWFWSHGKTGIFDIKDKILPTKWYEHQHPFEFEFIVNAASDLHKIFDNLEILSNSAEPESFHYEVTGDCYEFAKDKKNMYIRQEATRELYQYNGTDITFDDEYKEMESEHRVIPETDTFDKSTLLPLYYSRLDRINTIEDYYHGKDGLPTRDFSYLAGGEIVKDARSGEFRIWNHAEAVSLLDGGRLRGNTQYKEDKWYVLINPLNIKQCNEPDWNTCTLQSGDSSKVPIEITQAPLPDEILQEGEFEPVPGDTRGITAWNPLSVLTSESKLKDKWIKIRIRYSGKKLAIIHSVLTLFSISKS